jgi:voltage-gated sodium channel
MTDTTVPQDNLLRGKVRTFVELAVVRNTISGIIIFNAITLGLTTSEVVIARTGFILNLVDNVVLTIFVLELTLKFFAYRLGFFRNAWNIFDLCVVSVGLLPQTDSLSAVRGLRVIRAMRRLSVVPQMRAVVQALLDALPGMFAVTIMISIVFYVFVVMETIMYGGSFDVWFGTLGRSLYSLFQIMTLESWSMGIVRPVMEIYPGARAFFVPFIVITAFSVLNLFIGLLVNTLQTAVEDDTEDEIEKLKFVVKEETYLVGAQVKELNYEIKALRDELRAMRGG